VVDAARQLRSSATLWWTGVKIAARGRLGAGIAEFEAEPVVAWRLQAATETSDRTRHGLVSGEGEVRVPPTRPGADPGRR
jgi:hypothetical protein